MNPVFRLDEVTKRFGRQVALNRVSLQGDSGTVIALLGENGAGKTTALRILLGLLECDAGLSEVFGMNSRTHGENIRRRVGYVPDSPTLYEWMTVAEIGWFAAGFYDNRFLPRYQELAKQFELPLDRKLKQLSKGMLAKVSLSLALAHQPELLILDEPTSGLDPMVRREFLESMVDVAADGRTVLLSSHQIAEVERVADVVAIIRKGKLEIVERLDELKSNVCELTVTLNNGSATIPDTVGEIIARFKQDRHWRLLVRGCDDERLNSLRQAPTVGHVDVRQPSLEEIFIGYMHTETDERVGTPPPDAVTTNDSVEERSK